MKSLLINACRRQSTRSFILAFLFGALLVLVGTAFGIFLANTNFASSVVHKISNLGSHLKQAPLEDAKTIEFESINTGLNTLEVATIPLGTFRGGGAIATLRDQLLFVAAKGQIGFLRADSNGGKYRIEYVETKVPMDFDRLKRSIYVADPNSEYEFWWFRALGALILERGGVPYLYVSHHRFRETCAEIVVSRLPMKWAQGSLVIEGGSWETVFAAQPCIDLTRGLGEFPEGQQAGGRLVRESEDKILLTVGDLEYDGYTHEQKVSMDPGTYYGKAIEINLDTKDVAIFASGLRNPQGLFISHSGVIWETEHGPQGGDELNILERGNNYGWPEVSYGVPYDFPARPWPAKGLAGRHDNFVKPVFAFLPSIGIGNVVESYSDMFPLWKGDLLVASLRDQAIWRLRLEDRVVVYSERIGIGHSIRDIHELAGGEIAALTDQGSLKMIRQKSSTKGDRSQKPKSIVVEGLNKVRDIFTIGAVPR